MTTLSFCTLGRFALQRAGVSLPDDIWPTHKSRQLVKLLLTARGQVMPTDQILEWLWPDLSPDRARNNLWVAVSQARRVLEPDLAPRAASAYLLNESEGYRLRLDGASDGSDDTDDAVCWDVLAFEQAVTGARALDDPQQRAIALHAACALYTGLYLADDLYETWAMPLRQSLQQGYLALHVTLGETYATLGRYAEAATQARTILAVEPADEPAYQALMRYAYFGGDQRAALQAYNECVAALRAELDVAPLPETVELYRQIQRHTLPLPMSAQPSVAAPEAIYSLTHTPFVGRALEYGLLVRAVQDAVRGQGRIVLIGGEPGIGKSRLTQETIAYARSLGMTTLMAHCYQVEQAIPYQPIVNLIDQVLLDTPAQTFLGLPPVYLAEMAALAPELGELVDTLPTLSDDGSTRAARRFRALQQCLELLAGEHGLLLAMDDIHWADHATRQFLHYLATHIAHLPIVLICTYRAEEAADLEMATFLDSVSRTPDAVRLAPARFSSADTNALLNLLAGSSAAAAELSEWLHAETDGNPFFLISILQSLVEQRLLHEDRPAWQIDIRRLDTSDVALTLPDALRESVRVRLRRVPAAMRRVLEVAAVLGRRFDFATLEAVSGENSLALVEIVEGLLQRQLLRETGDGSGYDFSHDKVREVVYHDISRARRVMLHRTVAQILEQDRGGSIRERAANLARHYEEGQVWEKAIAFLVLAADRSKTIFAVHEAVQFYDRALELAYAHPESTNQALVLDVHRRRGEVRALLGGRMPEAVADLQLVLDAARAAGDRDRQRELLIALGQVYRMADRLDLAMEYLNAALTICRECLDRRSLANVLHHLGTVAWSAGNNLQASIYHQEAADLSRGLDDLDLVTIQALHGRGEAFVAAARPVHALELFEESLALARRMGNKRYEAENLQMIGWSYIGLTGIGDYGRAYDALNQSLVLSSEAHLDWNSTITLAFIGWVHACQGDYGRALEMVQTAIEQLRAADLVRFLSMAYDFLGYIYQDLNLHRQALEAHAAGLQIGIEANVGFWLPRLCADVAIDRLRLGELGAGHDLEVAFSLTVDEYQRFHAVRCLEGLLEEGILTGRPDRTLHFAALLEGISQAGDLREQQMHVLRWRGAADRLQGKLAQAEEQLQAALALAQTIGRVRCTWDLHADLAALYREMGDPARAETHEMEVAAIVRRVAASLPDPALGAALPRTLLLEH